MENPTLSSLLKNAPEIYVVVDGTKIKVNDEHFYEQFDKLTDKAYFEPALAVALHEHTVSEIQHGYWLNFVYNATKTYAQMPFSELLISIKPNFYGFNIIRFNEERYGGRCYYLSLNNSSTPFFNYLVETYKK